MKHAEHSICVERGFRWVCGVHFANPVFLTVIREAGAVVFHPSVPRRHYASYSEPDEVNSGDLAPAWRPESPAWEGLIALLLVLELEAGEELGVCCWAVRELQLVEVDEPPAPGETHHHPFFAGESVGIGHVDRDVVHCVGMEGCEARQIRALEVERCDGFQVFGILSMARFRESSIRGREIDVPVFKLLRGISMAS